MATIGTTIVETTHTLAGSNIGTSTRVTSDVFVYTCDGTIVVIGTSLPGGISALTGSLAGLSAVFVIGKFNLEISAREGTDIHSATDGLKTWC